MKLFITLVCYITATIFGIFAQSIAYFFQKQFTTRFIRTKFQNIRTIFENIRMVCMIYPYVFKFYPSKA